MNKLSDLLNAIIYNINTTISNKLTELAMAIETLTETSPRLNRANTYTQVNTFSAIRVDMLLAGGDGAIIGSFSEPFGTIYANEIDGIALYARGDEDGNNIIETYATKEELEELSDSIGTGTGGTVDLSNYYTKAECDEKFMFFQGGNELDFNDNFTNIWFGYTGGTVTNYKFGNGTDGGLANIFCDELVCSSIDCDTVVKISGGNELNFPGTSYNRIWFNYDGAEVPEYKFGDGSGGLADIVCKEVYCDDIKINGVWIVQALRSLGVAI